MLTVKIAGQLLLVQFLQSQLMHLDLDMMSAINEKLGEFDQRCEKLNIAKQELKEYLKSHIFTIAHMTHSEFAAFHKEALPLDAIEKELREIDQEKLELVAFFEQVSYGKRSKYLINDGIADIELKD